MTEVYIGYIDFLLVPLYFLALLLIMKGVKKRNADNPLYKKYYVKGFVFKVACAIFYGLLIHLYYGYGDSLTYFKDAMALKHMINNGEETWRVWLLDFKEMKRQYLWNLAGSEGGFTVQRLSFLLSYIGMNRFFVVTIIFSALAYPGMFKMFLTFNEIMPGWDKRIAIIVLFIPSAAVYGSGILKDTICISSMGWLIYGTHSIFIKKRYNPKFFFIVIISASLLAIVKVYILAAFIIPYVLYLIMVTLRRIKSPLFRKVLFPLMVVAMISTYSIFSEQIEAKLGTYAIEKLLDTMKEQQQAYQNFEQESGSNFRIGTVEPSFRGFVKMMPAGITATLYRPFIWESKKLVMFFAAFESFSILLFTLFVFFKAGIIRAFRMIFNDPFIFLCFFYALIFATLVGLSTPNFGTLARYRIPVLPFYLAALMTIWYKYTAMKKTQAENAALFPVHQNPLPG